MFFDKKKDEKKLPDLPAPKTPFRSKAGIGSPDFAFDKAEDEKNPLPEFPEPFSDKSQKTEIKDPFDKEEDEKFEPIKPLQNEKTPKVVEMEEWHPTLPKAHEEDYGESPIPKEPPQPRKVLPTKIRREIPRTPVSSDIFVKIDKFNSARKSLAEAETKLEEIDNLIRKIRETKMKEEQELSIWEKDLAQAKAQIQNVSENIFEKLD